MNLLSCFYPELQRGYRIYSSSLLDNFLFCGESRGMVCDMLFCPKGEKGEHLRLSGIPPLTIKKFQSYDYDDGVKCFFPLCRFIAGKSSFFAVMILKWPPPNCFRRLDIKARKPHGDATALDIYQNSLIDMDPETRKQNVPCENASSACGQMLPTQGGKRRLPVECLHSVWQIFL